MLAFKFLCLAATAPLLVPAAYVVDTGATARDVGSAVYVSTALEHFGPNVTTLEGRTSITKCIKIAAAINTCFTLGNNIRAIGSSIASLIYGSSAANDCNVHTGSVDGAQWRFQAANDCHTTADLDTIRGDADALL
ncbi:hypothetical protein FB451DRAFT_1417215 [Mycena latifolia]|nr:hypothetical protein FB451DRAFT_1417215 [Mycena latifolia]